MVVKDDPKAVRRILQTRCRHDLELFAKMFFGKFCKYPFSPFHKDLFARWDKNERGTRWVDAAPRGSAKSTMVSLIKPIHDICYHQETYITIFSNTEAQALQKLRDIKNELLENDFLRYCYGSFFPNKKVSEKSFVASCNGNQTMVSGFGVGTQVRGIRFGSERPTKIILDDVEHSEEVFSEIQREKLENWFKEDLTYLGQPGTNIHFIGTVLHHESLLQRLIKNPNYNGKVYKAIKSWAHREDLWQQWEKIYIDLGNLNRFCDSHDFFNEHKEDMLKGSEVLWPEKNTYLDLMKKRVEIGRLAFQKEDQNEPVAAVDALFKAFKWFTVHQNGIHIESTGEVVSMGQLRFYAVIDPAAGERRVQKNSKADYTCILLGATDYKGRCYVLEDITQRLTPTESIDRIFQFCEMQPIEKFGVETNLFRNLIIPNIATAKKQREENRKKSGFKNWGIKVNFYDIINTENKLKRIFTLEPKVSNGWMLFNRNLSQEYKNQMEAFPMASHDDAPDATHMLWSLVEGRYNANGVNIDALGR